MTHIQRLGRVWGLVAEQAAARGEQVSVADVCAAVVPEVAVTGAWLSAGLDAQAGHLMQVTDEIGQQLADLQLTLGEGPSLDASASSGPVLASDLTDGESRARWPAFATAASQAGAAAVFVFPLVVGAIRAGVLGLYRDRPGPLSDFQLGDALVFADTATMLLLDAQDRPAGDLGPGVGPGGQPAGLAAHRTEIDQATGMLTEQLGVGIADAFVRLRAYAYGNDLPLADVARDIVARRLRLFPDSDLSLMDETLSCTEGDRMDGRLLSESFVELTDTLVADFDIIDFLHMLTSRSVELLDVSAAGLLLADPRGELRVVAASDEATRLLELFQLQNDQGPCLDCFHSGRPVAATDLSTDHRWPRFAAAAGQAGFSAVQALPMRLRDQVIGALNLFRVAPGAFDADVVPIGQALADVATIGLLNERSIRRTDTLNEQLQTALNSRVIIEQAKGKLAERLGIDVNQAFALLRDQARSRNERLSDVARAFVDGTQVMTVSGSGSPRTPRPGSRKPRPEPRPAP